MSGILYVCGTPIGNLGDITYRQLEILKSVDVIIAEDTRHTLQLLNYFKIKKHLISYHKFNEKSRCDEIIKILNSNQNVALVSDAGMPGICDPGEEIIKACYKENITVTTAPGPTAVITALVLSGISTNKYLFEGFLPKKGKERTDILSELKKQRRTIIFYESPHGIKNTLKDIEKHFGNRNIAVCRELTKKFEEIIKGTVPELIQHFENKDPKGEMVIVIEGANELEAKEESIFDNMSIVEHVDYYVLKGQSKKDAMKQVAKDRNLGKREIYQILLEHENK